MSSQYEHALDRQPAARPGCVSIGARPRERPVIPEAMLCRDLESTREQARRLGVRCVCIALTSLLAACNSVYGSYSADFAKLDTGGGSADLVGFALGAEVWNPDAKAIGFTEVRSWRDGSVGIDVLEWNSGGRFPYLRGEGYLLGLQADVGVVGADVDGFQNSNMLLALGGGVFARYQLHDQLWLSGSFGVRGYWDVTEPTTCVDGTTSSSTGQGTCSYHGGIAHYNDQLGDAFATEFMFGLVFTF